MKSRFLIVAVIAFVFSTASHAALVTVNPTSDGSLYTCVGCNTVSDRGDVLVSGYIQGAIKFATTSIQGQVSSALLTLNPYALPLWGANVDIYGYGTTTGTLNASDANAGTFLGTLSLPVGLGYGQDAYFDVTSFIASIHAPFIAFNLRTTGTDDFSSLEDNYGHPSQLLVNAVPEPASLVLFLAGILVLFLRRSKNFTRL
jgi:hypothetical protein